jgi:hypothetical protein
MSVDGDNFRSQCESGHTGDPRFRLPLTDTVEKVLDDGHEH